MRESNFAFPAQNRACVCITSQLYDRRALDTTSSLPLFNSLTHLTYLTSTSPRIREIMTMDGGLERLVRILREFCICPPPPENPSVLYGLSPPNSRPAKLVPTLNPTSFDKHAAYRFSLAFQCVVNIGVRGSEPIRSRVVQAGTLDVVGCILEAWLANKGFAVGPSTSATGIPRESREQRIARRQALAEQRQAEQRQAEQRQIGLPRPSQRSIADELMVRLDHVAPPEPDTQNDESEADMTTDNTILSDLTLDSSTSSISITPMSDAASSSTSIDTDPDTSTDTSSNTTPAGSNTPTGAVLVPGRERSGTIIARPIWDQPTPAGRHRSHRARQSTSVSPSTDTSRPETETEDDGDGDGDVEMENERPRNIRTTMSPTEHRAAHHSAQRANRRAVGIVSDNPPPPTLEVNTDTHIIINDAQGGVVGGDGVGVEDGIVALEPNDDFAMGAPPGAPGAIDGGVPPPRTVRNGVDVDRRTRPAPDVTPRAGTMNLPPANTVVPNRGTGNAGGTIPRVRGRVPMDPTPTAATPTTTGTTGTPMSLGRATGHNGNHHHRDSDSGPYRDEDVLLSLQLLAYLSKYPHVRQAFYKPRTTFHPASVNLPNGRGSQQQAAAGPSSAPAFTSRTTAVFAKEATGFLRALTAGGARGKEKEKAPIASTSTALPAASSPVRQTNVFSLVERFTFRPSSSETDLPNPPPKLPPEIQYWAGVIMRNACRKDESRGGIRQCANMLCGRWESYPREFAKCRRCRKAKYCGKECQSTAWSEGHRFWCSVKDGDEEAEQPDHPVAAAGIEVVDASADPPAILTVTTGGTVTGRGERRDRERQRHVIVGRLVGEATATARQVNDVVARNPPPPPLPVAPATATTTTSTTTSTGVPVTVTAAGQQGNTTVGRGHFSGPLYVMNPTARAALARPSGAAPVGNNPAGYARYVYTVPAPAAGESGNGRRRAETVTGATLNAGTVSDSPRAQLGEYFLQLAPGGGPVGNTGAGPGPSTGRRFPRATEDMVLD